MFGGAMPAANGPLAQMKCGKMNLEGTTVTSDARKGLLVLRKAEDGLMHLIWKDRNSNSVVDDLIVFEGDATIRHLEECKDGFAMLLEFSQTARKLFFYSQEPRKKGIGWSDEDIEKEKDLLNKVNSILTGTPTAAPASAPTGALGMSHAELMAMLGETVVPPTAPAPAAATTEAAPAPSSAEPADTPAGGVPGAAAPAAAGQFSADAISSILGNIPTPAAAAAPPSSATTAAPAFSADAISSILSGIQPGAGAAAGGPPVTLGDVLRPEDALGRVDSEMEAALAEHLPSSNNVPETAAGTLSTPQMAQATARFTEALYQGEAFGLMQEMRLNPTGLGVEPFLRALQASTDAEKAAAGTKSDDAEPMDTDKPEKMDES